jgi:hypothetical protein
MFVSGLHHFNALMLFEITGNLSLYSAEEEKGKNFKLKIKKLSI